MPRFCRTFTFLVYLFSLLSATTLYSARDYFHSLNITIPQVNDRYRKSELTLTQSTEQVIMNTAIKNEISKANSFLFSNIFCLNNNPAQVDQHFTK